jgi:hypothetical protein
MDKKTIGLLAFTNKKGIHALSLDEKMQASKKGNQIFLEKWKNQEYQELHRNKVRLGRLIARFNRIRKPVNDFGFFS